MPSIRRSVASARNPRRPRRNRAAVERSGSNYCGCRSGKMPAMAMK
jgi:hypothetical protein